MDDFNLEEFAKMFDAALASNNPSVKKALRNFLMIMALVESENQQSGPFTSLLNDVYNLRKRIERLEQDSTATRYRDNYTNTYPKQWTYTTGIGYPPSVSSTSATGGISSVDIGYLMNDLKTNSGWSEDEISSLFKNIKDI